MSARRRLSVRRIRVGAPQPGVSYLVVRSLAYRSLCAPVGLRFLLGTYVCPTAAASCRAAWKTDPSKEEEGCKGCCAFQRAAACVCALWGFAVNGRHAVDDSKPGDRDRVFNPIDRAPPQADGFERRPAMQSTTAAPTGRSQARPAYRWKTAREWPSGGGFCSRPGMHWRSIPCISGLRGGSARMTAGTSPRRSKAGRGRCHRQ